MRQFNLVLLTLGVIFTFGLTAHAGEPGYGQPPGPPDCVPPPFCNTDVNLSAADATATAAAINQTEVRNDVHNSNQQGQYQGQGQQQGQIGIVRDGDVVDNSNVTVRGDNVEYDFPVATVAPVFAGNCAQGISVQTHQFGGSAASSNPVCDYIAVAGAFIAAGERGEALRVIGKAEGAADWRFTFSRIRNVLTFGLL